ncbi:MAG TPA: hypothetical protein VFV34_02175, partial [Blastocatellia bacterium]|nr:hypothetical protein [Blastocatellia bacterium]
MTVTTSDDPPPGTPTTSEGSAQQLSLRQAIEQANQNGGETCILFDRAMLPVTIKPLVPLPALRSPGIVIDGFAKDENDCRNNRGASESPQVSILGASTDTSLGEKHENGILIRSNRCEIRGLAITGFKKAGVAIAPVCRFDNVGANVIEHNALVNNAKAGVLVLDPGEEDQPAVSHNINNRISANEEMGSATPIDLGGDGPTPNDTCDADEGPNTFLNFPGRLSVTRSGDTVTIDGAISPDAATCPGCSQDFSGTTVEIFAITQLVVPMDPSIPVGLAPAQNPPPAIQGISFLRAAVPSPTGSFRLEGLPLSISGGYTATFTDAAGNTSELSVPCSGFPLEIIQSPISGKLMFGPFNPAARTKEFRGLSQQVRVQNTGCSTLRLNPPRLERVVTSGQVNDISDPFFVITSKFDSQIRIEPGGTFSFLVAFTPSIPAVVTSDQERAR